MILIVVKGKRIIVIRCMVSCVVAVLCRGGETRRVYFADVAGEMEF